MTRQKSFQQTESLQPAEIAALRESLLRERQALACHYQEEMHAAREIQEEGGEDEEELASMDADRTFLFAMGESDRERVEEIEEALRRIDQGTYGFCQFTGEPIPLERLREIPWARYCTRHQSLAEEGLLASLG